MCQHSKLKLSMLTFFFLRQVYSGIWMCMYVGEAKGIRGTKLGMLHSLFPTNTKLTSFLSSTKRVKLQR